jgi:hypothetical protein
VSDVAGNDRTTTVSGIKIDRTKPTTTAEVAKAPESGWYQAGPQVTLTGSDNLSGATTFYTVNGGDKQTYSAPFTVGTAGTNTVVFWSVDGAGNIEVAPAPLTLKVDGDKPTTTVKLPPAPTSGWYITSGLPVAFEAKDGANGSGIAATYYSINTIDNGAVKKYGDPFTQSLPDGENKITFWSVDIAGNVEAKETVTQTVSVNVDTTAPSISGATVTRNADGTTTPREPNSYKWFNSPVDVKFTCADSGSGLQTGVAGCAGDTTLVNDGKDQTVRGDAVDVAGNKSSTVFGPVNIDQTKPTLSGAVSTTGRSAAGWYKDDATVTWTGVDPLSGIDPDSQPAPTTVTGEGGALVAGPVTIKDKAGNTSDAAKVEGIQIDRTAPSISGKAVNADGTERKANADGWFNSGVRVSFTATDALSGIQDKPSDVVLDEDGANQSAKGTTTDLADNANSATVSGINIDSKAPQTSANNKCDGDNGWCRGQTATVTLNAVDQGLSGVKEIRYIVNGGQEKSAAGASTEVLVPLAAKSGLATVEYWAVDKAGNAETKGGVSLKYDNIAPTVTHVVDPKANANGWNNSSATVTFSAKDDDAGSGVDTASVTAPVTVSAETSATGQVINGSAKDLAGNIGTDSATVKLDKTVPTITAAIKSGTVGANGWYTGPVTVGFTCGDTLSGIAECPADVVLNGDGKAQTASGTAIDMAGNEAFATVSGINIDSVKPAITVTGAKASYTLGEAHGITCSATDATSGVDANGCKVTVTGGTANGVGTFTYTATAKDNAGNVQTTSSATYTVLYKWEGFLQPINDTAHQVGTSTSIFKAGSTVPAKFQLKKVDGTVVQANTAPAWLTPAKGSATSVAVDEIAYSDPVTTGGSYSWSSTDSQYRYNYGTAKSQANYYWRIGTKLDDGQIYYVNLGLR